MKINTVVKGKVENPPTKIPATSSRGYNLNKLTNPCAFNCAGLKLGDSSKFLRYNIVHKPKRPPSINATRQLHAGIKGNVKITPINVAKRAPNRVVAVKKLPSKASRLPWACSTT